MLPAARRAGETGRHPSHRRRERLALLLALGLTLLMPAGCEQRVSPGQSGASDGAAVDTEIIPSRGTDEACPCSRPPSFAPAVDQVRPAVVNLYSERESTPDGGDTGPEAVVPDERRIESLGSGLIVDSQGHLLTNHHLVADAGNIRARLLDDRWFETTVVGTDPNTDLALLQLDDADDLPVAPLGSDADLRVGDWVVAIGNPLGLTSTATVGIASGIGRSRLPLGEELTYQDFIQTDASINPGNSGGPLIDADGNVVGINTAMSAEARGIGFAIPVSMARDVLRKLRESGEVRRSWVGLYIEAVPEPLRTELDVGSGGVLVTGVVDDGPADEAGLQKGDVLLKVGDREVEDVDQVSWLAGHLTIGDPITLFVQRGHEQTEVDLVPTEPPENTDE